MIKIAKFGGSSVADAEHFKKIKAIGRCRPGSPFCGGFRLRSPF